MGLGVFLIDFIYRFISFIVWNLGFVWLYLRVKSHVIQNKGDALLILPGLDDGFQWPSVTSKRYHVF